MLWNTMQPLKMCVRIFNYLDKSFMVHYINLKITKNYTINYHFINIFYMCTDERFIE